MGIRYFRTVCPDFLAAAMRKPGAMAKGGFEARMFMYQAPAFKLCLFFASYQIKNLFDTIVWNDGIEVRTSGSEFWKAALEFD